MKTLLIMIAMVATMGFSQTTMTPARLAQLERGLEQAEYLTRVTWEAQEKAKAVQRPEGFGETENFFAPLVRPARPVLTDTNAKVAIQVLSIMENLLPGSTTNIQPHQLYDATTNAEYQATMDFFRNAPPQDRKIPSGGGDFGWTNAGVDSWTLEFTPMPWDGPPALPYFEPGTTNVTTAPLKPKMGLEYPTPWGTNRVRYQTNSLSAMTCPDFHGAFGGLLIRYPEVCYLPEVEWFRCATGRLYGVRSGSGAGYDEKDHAIMSGGYVMGLWIWQASITHFGGPTIIDFDFVNYLLYPPTKAVFFSPPFNQGPMIEPLVLPLPPGQPILVYQFGAAASQQQVETSTDGVNWTVLTNGLTGDDGILAIEAYPTNVAAFFRGASTPPPL